MRHQGAIPAPPPAASSGVPWIDRKVRELGGARAHLDQIGLTPRPATDDRRDYYRQGTGWRITGWVGVFTDDQLIDLARERGFRP
jgi:hypothetical protein